MAGREKHPLYHYDGKGEFIKKYASTKEAVRDIDNLSHTSLTDKETIQLKNGEVLSRKAIGRVGVREFLKYENNDLIGKHKQYSERLYKKANKGKVEIYDLDGDLIMTCKSPFYLTRLLGLNASAVSSTEINKLRNTRKGFFYIIRPIDD